MGREILSLEGYWDFSLENGEYKGKIYVPSIIQAEFPDLKYYYGNFYYKKTFNIPENWLKSKILLRFSAVDYYSEVWINGKFVGSHEGGFLPFYFFIEDFVKAGENEILVKIMDSNTDKIKFSKFSQDEIPHGKAHDGWYGNISGIWQKVYLERLETPYVENVKVIPDIDEKKIKVETYIKEIDKDCILLIKIYDPIGRVFSKEIKINSEKEVIDFSFPEVILWDIDNPNLYNLEIQIFKENSLKDIYKNEFGMRKIEVKNGEIYLNNKPLYIFGALDQDFYPEKIYIPNSIEEIRKRFQKAKEMGINLLRTHVKIPLPEYLYLADHMGILIWEELPYWENLTEEAKERAKKTLKGMIERDFNHPSIIIWGIINESWGIDLNIRENREWLKEMYNFVKSLDPTRLVVDNSPCIPNFHIKTDLEDFHFYTSIPDHAPKWEDLIKGFSKRDFWIYSPYGDAEKGKKPLLISEFGNWGLYNITENFTFHIPKYMESSPPWETRKRFYSWKLDEVFGSFEEFIKETQRHEFISLKYEIEVIRKHSSIKGYIITELTDVFWESNGLLDPWGNSKIFHNDLKWLNNINFIALSQYKANWYSGEKMNILVEGYLNSLAEKLILKFEDSKDIWEKKLENLKLNQWQILGDFSLNLPEVKNITKKRLLLFLKNNQEKIIAKNFYDFYIFPKEEIKKESNLLRIKTFLSKEDKEFLKKGENILILATNEHALEFLKEEKNWQIISRKKDMYHGDWINNFNFHRKVKFLLDLSLPNPWDFSFLHLIPENLIIGIEEKDAEKILAGTFYGWILNLGGYLLEVPYEKGKIIITTLNFKNFSDPLTVWIWNRIIENL
ncbi:MAG: hypothetical protein N2312_06565 [Dictyoglomaceae bacterium]|nr:hypothetical protein [Dictyoglomaceae bacterium]